MYTKKAWFHAKNYGWGWTPWTWQGWGLTILWLLAMIGDFLWIDGQSHSASDMILGFAPHAVTMTGLFVIIAALTGEKPEWRWAGKRVSPVIIVGKMIMTLVVIFFFAMLALKMLDGAAVGVL